MCEQIVAIGEAWRRCSPAVRPSAAGYAEPIATPHLRGTILKALSCNLLALDGHERVDGVNAIKMIMKPLPGLPVRKTLWLHR